MRLVSVGPDSHPRHSFEESTLCSMRGLSLSHNRRLTEVARDVGEGTIRAAQLDPLVRKGSRAQVAERTATFLVQGAEKFPEPPSLQCDIILAGRLDIASLSLTSVRITSKEMGMYQKLGPTSVVGTPASRRSARALLNDQAIRRATVNAVLRQGIDAISFRDIGREAGLTHGALYARCEDVEELLVDVWANELCDRAITMMTLASKAVARANDAAVHDVITYIKEASANDRATVQILLASRRFPVLREEVEIFVRDYLDVGADLTDDLHSRSLVVFSLMLSTILSSTQFRPDHECLDFLEVVLRESLKVDPKDVAPVRLHEAFDRVLPEPRVDIRSQLAYETFCAIAKSGYARATISRISRRASCSPGSIYKIYPSKDDLAIAAIRFVMKAPWITTQNFCAILDEGALAQLLSASASALNDVRKYFTLEIILASTQNAQIRAAAYSQLQNLEMLVPFVSGLEDEESAHLGSTIRLLSLLSLGSSFLSTVMDTSERLDFNQFAEPLRRSLAKNLPSWAEVQRQLRAQVIPQHIEPPLGVRPLVGDSSR